MEPKYQSYFLPGCTLLIYIPVIRNQVWRCVLPFFFFSLIEIHQRNRLRVPSMQRCMTQSRLYKNTVSEGRADFHEDSFFIFTSYLRPLGLWHQIPLMAYVWNFRGLGVVFSSSVWRFVVRENTHSFLTALGLLCLYILHVFMYVVNCNPLYSKLQFLSHQHYKQTTSRWEKSQL